MNEHSLPQGTWLNSDISFLFYLQMAKSHQILVLVTLVINIIMLWHQFSLKRALDSDTVNKVHVEVASVERSFTQRVICGMISWDQS